MHVDIRQLVLAIGRAVDLIGIDDVWHGRRVGVIAVEIARRLGWDRATQMLLFDAGVVHDCGVSSTRVHRNLVNEFDWEDAHLHCEKGHEFLKGFSPLSHLGPIVAYHHTHWNDLAKARCEPMTALFANLIYLADRIDVRSATCPVNDSLLISMTPIRDLFARHRGTFFAPELWWMPSSTSPRPRRSGWDCRRTTSASTWGRCITPGTAGSSNIRT